MYSANVAQNGGTNKEGSEADMKKTIINVIHFHYTFPISLYFIWVYYLEMKTSGCCILNSKNWYIDHFVCSTEQLKSNSENNCLNKDFFLFVDHENKL